MIENLLFEYLVTSDSWAKLFGTVFLTSPLNRENTLRKEVRAHFLGYSEGTAPYDDRLDDSQTFVKQILNQVNWVELLNMIKEKYLNASND